MTNYKLDPWRIGTDATNLLSGFFFILGLPLPEAFDYETYTEQVPQSQGSAALQGYSYVSIVWNGLTGVQAYALKSRIQTVRAAGTELYLTIPEDGGDVCKELGWIDVSGWPALPRFTSPPNSHGRIYAPVELRVNNLTVVNDPASGV